MAKKPSKQSKGLRGYTAKDIFVLQGLEPVRKRPGMYIGSTGKDGLHHLVWEVVDNALDEAMAGYATRIDVTLNEDGSLTVQDNGRGIPVEKHQQTKKSALETVMTTLHAGGKFGGESYKIAGGLHGVGVSVVNALSAKLLVEVCRDGILYRQEYARGKPTTVVQKKGRCNAAGTTVTFWPDTDVFGETVFDRAVIVNRLRQQAYLTKGVTIHLLDRRGINGTEEAKQPSPAAWTYTLHFEGGVVSYVRHLNRREQALHDRVFLAEREVDGVLVEIALQYVDSLETRELGFANNIFTPEGGMHITGFRTALTRVMNDYARKNGLLKGSEDNLTGEDVREGLTAVVSVKMREPQFEGQTKAKLGSPEARTVVEQVMGDAFDIYLEKNPSDARAIIQKTILSQKARRAAKAARETIIRKGILNGLSLPGKLADCQSHDPAESELFIVEGESAGGTAKGGRDRRFQAVLPLRGKILNVERARLDRMLMSNEIKALVVALGAAIAEEFNMEKLRYRRIIIMTDADVDGAHIRTLLLTLFFRYFRPIIDAGYLYIARPPLYKITKGSAMSRYVYDEDEKLKVLREIAPRERDVARVPASIGELPGAGEKLVSALQKAGIASLEDVSSAEVEKIAAVRGVSAEKAEALKEAAAAALQASKEVGAETLKGVGIQRYKGLGEMNAEELWETTLNPAKRLLRRVTVEDAEEADEIFETLMGEEVGPRKKFIQTHARHAEIDV